ncbi:MAG: efflux RND transporter periplasmic adaptor subunit, partial [Planctomycetota bacterium]
MSSPPNQSDQRHDGADIDPSLFYLTVFQTLKSIANASSMVVWDASLENSSPLFVCASNGKPPDAKLTSKKRTYFSRLAVDEKRIISGKRLNDEASQELSNVEVFLRFDEQRILQVGFPNFEDEAAYRKSIEIIEESLNEGLFSSKSLSVQKVTSNSPPSHSNSARTKDLFSFFSNLHLSLDRKTTDFQIANELRKITFSDRVCVFRTGFHPKTVAVSGSTVVNRRSELVRLLEKFVGKIAKTKKVFRYPSDQCERLPKRLQSTLTNYLAEGSSRAIFVYPIFEHKEQQENLTNESSQARRRIFARRIIGVMTIEFFRSQPDENQLADLEKCSACAADAFRNSYLHRRLFLYPVWDFLGKMYEFLIGRHLSKTVFAIAAMGVMLACLFLIKTEYRLSCDGSIRPLTNRNVYAEIDGLVIDVKTDTGQFVNMGQELFELENKDLLVRKQELIGNIDVLTQRIESIDRYAVGDARNPNQSNDNTEQLSIERTGLTKQIETLKEQLSVLQVQIGMQTVRSPIDGEVITANVIQELENRPVSRG